MENLSVAVTKRVPVVLSQRRRHRRIPETRMAGEIGRRAILDVAARRLDAVMVALLRSLRVSLRRRRGRWRIKSGRLWMGTSRDSESK
jgi:hypothetical protein